MAEESEVLGRTMFAPTDLRGKRHNNNVNRLHKRQSESLRRTYRKRQTKAFGKPKADSEGNERFRRTG